MAVARRKIARRKAEEQRSRQRLIVTSLHIDISDDDDVLFPPLLIQNRHAMALLKMVLAVSSHLVEVQGGRA